MPQRIYGALPVWGKEDAAEILETRDPERLFLLPLSLGEYCEDGEYAQAVCLQLAQHADEQVRANAMLGLSYVARNHRVLDKELVMPVFQKALKARYENLENFGRAENAAEDIEIFLGWTILQK